MDGSLTPLMERPLKRVTIVGMGMTGNDYFNMVRNMGHDNQGNTLPYPVAGPLMGEVWGINLMGPILNCDRVIQMNDPDRWAGGIEEVLDSAGAVVETKPVPAIYGDHILERFRRATCPIYTVKHHPDFPSTVPYPIRGVCEAFRSTYFNNSVAYAIALAVYEGATDIGLFGCDFSYADPSLQQYREEGRACVEFWISQAIVRGVRILVPQRGTLLDAHTGQLMYGYFATPEKVLAPPEAAQPAEPQDAAAGEVVALPTHDTPIPAKEAA